MNQAKAAFFDAQAEAPWAAAEYGPEETPKIGRLLREGRIKPGQGILEPGCGTGRLTEVLAQAVGPQGRLTALDISPRMIAAARVRLAGRANVALLRAGLEDLPIDLGPFDRIVCHQVFPHFDDQPAAVAAMAGRLAAGGLIVVVQFAGATHINAVHRQAGGAIENDLLPGVEEMKVLFAQAGLDVDLFLDDDLGYFLRAQARTSENSRRSR